MAARLASSVNDSVAIIMRAVFPFYEIRRSRKKKSK